MKITFSPQVAARILSVDEALDLVEVYIENRKKRTHTFEKWGFGLAGCNMDMSTIKQRIKQCTTGEILLSNTVVGHNVAFIDKTRDSWLFLQTDLDKVKAIKKLRRIKN